MGSEDALSTELCALLRQVGIIAATVLSHCRRAPEMGLLTPEEFNAASRGIRGAGVSDIVAPGPAVLLRSGYHAHLRRARPPPAMGPPPTLPPGWSTVEQCVVVEVGPSGKAHQWLP